MPTLNISEATTSKQVLGGKYMLQSLCRSRSLVNLFTQDLDEAMMSDGVYQTDSNAPIINITDLTKSHGTQVFLNNLNRDSSFPVMGSGSVEGQEISMKSSDFGLKIDATRYPVKSGAIMARQAQAFDWNKIVNFYGGEWHSRIAEQRMIFHIAGGRGHYQSSDIIVPLASHPRFDEIMINPVTAPTYNRTWYANDRAGFSSLTAADKFNAKALIGIRKTLDEQADPIGGVSLRGSLSMDKSMYILLVTPTQWADYKNDSKTKDFELKVANALSRTKGWSGNVLFDGEMFYDEGILVMKYHTPVRYKAGEAAKVGDNSKAGGETSVTNANVNIDAAILIGGQALVTAWGHANPHENFKGRSMSYQGNGFHIAQSDINDGAQTRTTSTVVNGCAKLVFTNDDGYKTDRGCGVLFTATS